VDGEIIDENGLIQIIRSDISSEYQILNKFSTEKFSVILLLIGLFGIFVTIWPVLSKYVNLGSLLYYWFIGNFVLLIIWIFSIIASVRHFLKNKQKNNLTCEYFKNYLNGFFQEFKELIINDINNSENNNSKNFESLFHRYTNQLYILVDYISRNTETRMKPVIISFIFLFLICIIHLKNYFYVSVLSFENFLPLTHTSLVTPVLIYAFIFIILGIFWNLAVKIAQKYFGFIGSCISFMILKYGNYKQKVSKNKNLWKGNLYRIFYLFELALSLLIGLGVFTILFLVLAIITVFIFVFPFVVLISTFYFNLISYTPNFIENFIISIIIMYLFFKVLEILFSIHLVEQIKNDKITWLKWLNVDIKNDEDFRVLLQKYQFSDVYMPISYTSLWAFTRYELLPISLYDDPEFLRERLNFMRKHK